MRPTAPSSAPSYARRARSVVDAREPPEAHGETLTRFLSRHRRAGVLVFGLVAEQPHTPEPAHRPLEDSLRNAFELRRGRWLETKEDETSVSPGEDAIEEQCMSMNVQIQRTAHSLNAEDGARVDARLAEPFRLTLLKTKHLAVEDADDRTKNVGACGHRVAKLVGHDQRPLTKRDIRQNAIDEVRGLTAHASCSATGTETSALA